MEHNQELPKIVRINGIEPMNMVSGVRTAHVYSNIAYATSTGITQLVRTRATRSTARIVTVVRIALVSARHASAATMENVSKRESPVHWSCTENAPEERPVFEGRIFLWYDLMVI